MWWGVRFQSTSSVWRTTGLQQAAMVRARDFNPRPPCGGRLAGRPAESPLFEFQSTSSVWRTTGAGAGRHAEDAISIHVLRVEDDCRGFCVLLLTLYFNPRPPCGGRLVGNMLDFAQNQFQSTSSVWRTTKVPAVQATAPGISIHVLRVEDDMILGIRLQ